MILYEDRGTCILAMRLLDRLAARLTPEEYAVRRSLWWRDVMVVSMLRRAAIEEARAADVVLVAVRGHRGGIEDAQAWLEACVANDTGQPAILAALVAMTSEDTEASVALRGWLAELAARSGRRFVSAEVGLDSTEGGLVRGSGFTPELQAAEVLVSYRQHPAGRPNIWTGLDNQYLA